MAIKIASWNIEWKGIRWTNRKLEDIEKENRDKLLIAKQLAEDYNIVALLEADSDPGAHIELEGYKKIYCSRNYSKKEYAWNGILLYVKDCFNPQVNMEVIKEFEDNDLSCFLPVNIAIKNEVFNCLFVWTLANRYKEPYYGYSRFYDLLSSKGANNFKKSREFIDGAKNNVIIIGDYNIYIQKNLDEKRLENWNNLVELMNNFSLKWIENDKPTFGKGANDHCFVSKNLHEVAKLNVGDTKFGYVKSDHNLLSLSLQ